MELLAGIATEWHEERAAAAREEREGLIVQYGALIEEANEADRQAESPESGAEAVWDEPPAHAEKTRAIARREAELARYAVSQFALRHPEIARQYERRTESTENPA